MRRAICLLIAFAVATSLQAQEPAQFAEYSAPIQIILSPEQATKLRETLESPSPHRPHIQSLRSRADEACLREPAPLPVLVYEGRVSNDPERIRTTRHLQDMPALICLTYAWQITGEAKYADAAQKYARAWAQTCPPTGNDVNDVKLLPVVYALGVLQERMDVDTRELIAKWSRELDAKNLAALRGSASGNRPAKRLHMLAVSAAVRQDPELTQQVRRLFLGHIERTLRPDGTSTDLEERDALHYHISTVEPLLKVALALDPGLLDAASPSGASLRKSLDYVLPYARGEQVHAEWVNTKVELDRRRAAAGDPHYRPGKPWPRGNAAQSFALAALMDGRYRELAAELTHHASADDETAPVDCLVD